MKSAVLKLFGCRFVNSAIGTTILLLCSPPPLLATEPTHLEALYQAEQAREQGNRSAAATILHQILEGNYTESSPVTCRKSALRLLVNIYYESGDDERVVALGQRYASWAASPGVAVSRLDSAELAGMMTDAYLRLGRLDEARQALAEFQLALSQLAINGIREARLVRQFTRLATALERSNAPSVGRSHSSPSIDPAKFLNEQRLEAIVLCKEQHLDAGEPENAVALLRRELNRPAYQMEECSILKHHLVESLHELAAEQRMANRLTSYQASLEAQQRLVEELLTELVMRKRELRGASTKGESTRTFGHVASEVARLCQRQGDLLERQAQLTRDNDECFNTDPTSHVRRATSQRQSIQQLRQALAAYNELYAVAKELEAIDQAAANSTDSATADLASASPKYVDAALSGKQRVYEQLRIWGDVVERPAIEHQLLDVSQQLVEHRAPRLLTTDPELLESKQALAYVYGSLNRHQDALPLFRDLVHHWDTKAAPKPLAAAQAYLGMAETLRALDRTGEARCYAEQAAAVVAAPVEPRTRQSRAADCVVSAAVRQSLAAMAISTGDYQRAVLCLDEADGALKVESSTHLESLSSHRINSVRSHGHIYRALLHKAQADYEQSASEVRQSRTILAASSQSPDLLKHHLAEASIYIAWAKTLGASERAETLAQAAAALQSAKPLVTNDSESEYRFLAGVLRRLQGGPANLNGEFLELAHAAETRDDYRMAAKCYLELAYVALAPSASHSTASTTGAATCPDKLASREAVEVLLDKKLELRHQLSTAAKYASLAVDAFRRLEIIPTADGRATKSHPALNFQAAYLAARTEVHRGNLAVQITELKDLLATGHANKSKAMSQSGLEASHRQRAIKLLESAIERAESPASSTSQQGFDRAKFFSLFAPAYDLLVDLYVAQAVGNGTSARLTASDPCYTEICRALEVADQARNRTFHEQVAAWQDKSPSEVGRHFQWHQQIEALVSPRTAILVYHLGGRQPQDLSRSSAAAGIAMQDGGHLFVVLDGGKTIEYFRLRDQSDLKDGATTRTLRESLTQSIAQHTQWLTGIRDERIWGRRSQRQLSDMVLPPDAIALLTNQSPQLQRIVLVCDGPLQQLPFESLLLTSTAGRNAHEVTYLLDALPPMSYGPSLSVLSAADERHRAHDAKSAADRPPFAILTVGNPTIPSLEDQRQSPAWNELLTRTGLRLSTLPHALRESQAVLESFSDFPIGRRVALCEGNATETSVRRTIERSRFVHLAVHGLVDHENDNLAGGLALAPGPAAERRANDGLLQLEEIYDLNLANCELAALSACQTKAGADRPLETEMSMARAFLERGAKRVVCSHWSIDDEATAELMSAFFWNLRQMRQARQPIDYASALRNAKRQLRDDTRWRANPGNWSAIVLVGM